MARPMTSAPVPRPLCALCRTELTPANAHPFRYHTRDLFVTCTGCAPMVVGAASGAAEAAKVHVMPKVQRAIRGFLAEHPVLRAAFDGYIRTKESR
jgi:hypothetical protein